MPDFRIPMELLDPMDGISVAVGRLAGSRGPRDRRWVIVDRANGNTGAGLPRDSATASLIKFLESQNAKLKPPVLTYDGIFTAAEWAMTASSFKRKKEDAQ